MYLNSKLAKSVRLALTLGAASAAVFSSNVLAQEEAASGDAVEKIAVTGSRIKRANLESASPVTVISSEDIMKTGIISVGDLLQDLPAAGSALNTATNNGGDGSTRVDLRNLGSQRVLVLVNGKRWMNSASSGVGASVDLNTIPVAAIERMEVLKDGASAVYGSDAIAGVVNIITKKNFQGLDANVYFGKTAEDDGHQRHVDLTFGITGDKGSFLASVNYDNQGVIWAGDRDISATGYSTSPPWGRYRDLQNVFPDAGYASNLTLNGANLSDGLQLSDFRPMDFGSGNEGDFSETDPGDRFNYAPTNYLLTPNERLSLYMAGNYELADDLVFSSDFVYTNRKSQQTLAPMPLTLGYQFGPLNGAGYIAANNPYNPFGTDLYFEPQDLNGNGVIDAGTNENSIRLQRRMEETGQRKYTQDVHTYRFSAGLEGEFNDWFWDANFIYGESRNTTDTTGLLLLSNIFTALGDVDNCLATQGCVPLNLFGQGQITQDMVDYITFQGVDTNSQRLLDYNFNLSGELFELPAGMVGFAAGFEHRLETGTDVPNPYTQGGQSSGNQRNPTSGGFSMDEYYVEFNVPVIEDLNVSLAARRSEHSSYGSNTTTKIGVEYRPIEELLVRATVAEGFRAPSISQLVGGGGDSYSTANDPCNGFNGDTTALPGCAGVPSTYSQANPQIRTTLTSETAPGEVLQPETSDSFTAGVVYSPEFVEGLELTLDYFDIELEDAITRLGTATILNQCTSTGTIYCDKITRGPSGDILELKRNFINAGGLETAGVDFSARYTFDIQDYGNIKLTADATYVKEYNQINEDVVTGDTSVDNQLGLEQGDFGVPRWKANFQVDWEYNDMRVSWSGRYIHDMCNGYALWYTEYGCEQTVDGTSLESAYSLRHPDAIFYQDLQFLYHFSDYNTAVTLGIKNIFDEQPEMEADPENGFWYGGVSANNFDSTLYDPNLARFAYINVGVRF